MYRLLILVTFFFALNAKSIGQQISKLPIATLQHRVEQASDTIFVVNFWATWCQPCVKEIPEFNKIPASYAGKPVKVIMANLDFPNQIESRVIPFLKSNLVVHEVVAAVTPRGGEWIEKLDPAWSGAIPATIIVHQGKRFFHEGETDYETIKEWINSLL